ncbi:MAG: serine hydrolase [Firmicutes bacterium]|nr:serine hydrolase [Bacillota bacterium]
MKTNKTMKKFISTLAIAALILLGTAPSFAFAQEGDATEQEIAPSATFDDSRAPNVNAGSAILVNVGNGDIIYEKNAHQLREPASVTKVLTLLVALENLKLNQEIKVSDDVERAGSTMGLEPGEKLTVEQLMYGMMLVSGNDAAQQLALAAGGSQKGFAKMMNARARECGAQDSNFKNPNGLNEVANALNVTTAYDLAMIACEGMKDKRYRKIVGTAKYVVPKTNKSKKRVLRNTNYTLWDTQDKFAYKGKDVPFKYDGCTGVKTGYTTSAGDCYVGTAKRGNMELVVVLLHSVDKYSRFVDARSLWDYGFKYYKTYTAQKAEDFQLKQKVRLGSLARVELGIKSNFDITLDKDSKAAKKITTEVKLNEEKPTAPIQKGDVMGKIEAYNGKGVLIGVKDIVALETVEKGGPLSHIGIADEYAWIVYLILGLIIAFILFVLIMRAINRRKRKIQRGRQRPMKRPTLKRPTLKQTAPEEPAAPTRPERPAPAAGFENPQFEKRKIEPPLSQQLRGEAPPAEPPTAERPSYSESYDRSAYDRSSFGGTNRPTRTRAEKRAARKERARRRKERQRNSGDVRH